MGLNTYPANPFPPSTDQMDADALEAEVSKLKSGLTNIEVALNVPEGTGKNLLAIPDDEYSSSGITYTVNNTAIQVVGTATANSYYTFYSWNKLKNTFLASYAGKKFKISNTSDDVRFTLAYRKDSSSTASEYNVFNGEAELTLPSDTTYEIYLAFRVLSGVSVNTVIYPMIRPATINDPTFAPYIPSVESRIDRLESVYPLIVSGTTPNGEGDATFNTTGIDFTSRYLIAAYIVINGTSYKIDSGFDNMEVSMTKNTKKPVLHIGSNTSNVWLEKDCFVVYI